MKRMKSRADPDAPPILMPRERLLLAHGPGVRPCLDGAANWLGCPGCKHSCILAPGHQLDLEERSRRYAELKAKLAQIKADEKATRMLTRTEKHTRVMTVKKVRKTEASGAELHDAIASVPARDLLPESVKKCGLCGVPMRPIGNALVCSKCEGVLTTRKAVS